MHEEAEARHVNEADARYANMSKPLAKSTLYSEDVREKGHAAVWGSAWERSVEDGAVAGTGRWGFACCRLFIRDLPCPLAVAEGYEEPENHQDELPLWNPEPEEHAAEHTTRPPIDPDTMDEEEIQTRKKTRAQDWDKRLSAYREELWKAAEAIMAAEYGTAAELPSGLSSIPLRLVMRRKDVCWEWMGETQPFIGHTKRALSPDGW